MSIHGPVGAVALWMLQCVSLTELSFQLRIAFGVVLGPINLAVRLDGAIFGATATAIGRMKSFSSWPRIWQWYTYSQPKLTRWLTTGAWAPVGSRPVNPCVEPSARCTSSGRIEFGTSHGIFGVIGLIATIVSINGGVVTVSFQPSSLGSGGNTTPSHLTRLSTWRLNICQ